MLTKHHTLGVLENRNPLFQCSRGEMYKVRVFMKPTPPEVSEEGSALGLSLKLSGGHLHTHRVSSLSLHVFFPCVSVSFPSEKETTRMS